MEPQPRDEELGPVLDYARPPKPRVPTYRKVLAWGLICGGLPFLVIAMTQANPAARANIMLPGFALIVLGVVIRFQHVRF